MTDCVLFGGVSGRRIGWIVGALREIEADDGRKWQRCWSVIGARATFADQGDSGGAVVVAGTGELLGHLVGTMGRWRRKGSQAGIVQDASTVIEQLRRGAIASDFLGEPRTTLPEG